MNLNCLRKLINFLIKKELRDHSVHKRQKINETKTAVEARLRPLGRMSAIYFYMQVLMNSFH